MVLQNRYGKKLMKSGMDIDKWDGFPHTLILMLGRIPENRKGKLILTKHHLFRFRRDGWVFLLWIQKMIREHSSDDCEKREKSCFLRGFSTVSLGVEKMGVINERVE